MVELELEPRLSSLLFDAQRRHRRGQYTVLHGEQLAQCLADDPRFGWGADTITTAGIVAGWGQNARSGDWQSADAVGSKAVARH